MSALDLLFRTIKSQKFGRPFYSKLDEALENLPRQKGTAEEFLREIEKQPGVKKAEIEDRGIKKALAARARAPDANRPITKEQMQKILYDQAPVPPVIEDVLGGKDAKYQKWRTPGGKNYREILLKLPEDYLYSPYISNHFGDNPNILAHIRASDYEIPNKGFLVVNTKSGNRSEAFKTAEEAQAYLDNMPESMRPSLKITEGQGTPKKVLLVDEIQSDWHQAARDLRNDEVKRIMNATGVDKKTASAQVPDDFGYRTGYERSQINNLANEYEAMTQRRRDLLKQAEEMPDGGVEFAALIDEANDITPKLMRLQSEMDTLRYVSDRGMPDAPFKKNWHELAMKRVLDYAAENGYDSIAITPGAEQAKRYDLSQHVDAVIWERDPDGRITFTPEKEGMALTGPKTVSQGELADHLGKEVAEKILNDQETSGALGGVDLQVGGEGMKGFYDKILPDYLNNYGKKYGAAVREAPMNYTPSAQRVEQGAQDDALLGQLGVETPTVAPTQYHMFDITPQMRQEINTKGQPMYGKVAMPALEGLAAGSGAATIGSQVFDENNEQQVQNPVHFTENPDAMLLELMQRN
jgi:hypothetical protein